MSNEPKEKKTVEEMAVQTQLSTFLKTLEHVRGCLKQIAEAPDQTQKLFAAYTGKSLKSCFEKLDSNKLSVNVVGRILEFENTYLKNPNQLSIF
jgi:hypothetical protein